MKKNPDIIIARIIMMVILIIAAYWIWNGLIWLWDWYLSVSNSPETGFWEEVWLFIKDNLSIIAMLYGIIALQASGVAELKFGKKFITAFALALFLTPPVMMAFYGARR